MLIQACRTGILACSAHFPLSTYCFSAGSPTQQCVSEDSPGSSSTVVGRLVRVGKVSVGVGTLQRPRMHAPEVGPELSRAEAIGHCYRCLQSRHG